MGEAEGPPSSHGIRLPNRRSLARQRGRFGRGRDQASPGDSSGPNRPWGLFFRWVGVTLAFWVIVFWAVVQGGPFGSGPQGGYSVSDWAVVTCPQSLYQGLC